MSGVSGEEEQVSRVEPHGVVLQFDFKSPLEAMIEIAPGTL